jgi:Reverse transcriptase (RNA-dependent DNA polymerase)
MFSPVGFIKPTTVRIVLSIVLSHNWPMHQLDLNNTFLHGQLKETVYMAQPPRFSDRINPSHVCKLKKSSMDLSKLLDIDFND